MRATVINARQEHLDPIIELRDLHV